MNDPEPNGLTRITFNAVPRAADALAALSSSTGLSKTDLLNRAVLVLRIVEEWISEPGGLRIVRADGQVERVYVI